MLVREWKHEIYFVLLHRWNPLHGFVLVILLRYLALMKNMVEAERQRGLMENFQRTLDECALLEVGVLRSKVYME
jgi:hypothetical protein